LLRCLCLLQQLGGLFSRLRHPAGVYGSTLHSGRLTAERLGTGMSYSPYGSTSLAARMGHRSATHCKAGVLGWLAFVVVTLLAGQMVTQP
jgi:hypothetical protein